MRIRIVEVGLNNPANRLRGRVDAIDPETGEPDDEREKLAKEGEVLDFPTQPKVSDENIQHVITLENSIGETLGNIYGNQSEIPLEIIEQMETLIDAVEQSLKK